MKQATIQIRDLGLAAALSSLGVEITSTKKDETGRTYFIFAYKDDDEANIDTVITEYWANTLDVKARYYFDAIKMLKSRIYGDQ